jgi:hypothetical protein
MRGSDVCVAQVYWFRMPGDFLVGDIICKVILELSSVRKSVI